LDFVRTEVGLGRHLPEISQSSIFGFISGSGFEFVNIGFLIGGLCLIYMKVISWHIPLALFAGISVIATLCYFINPLLYTNPLIQLFGGATILGAFFIATDPITAATTKLGKIVYGFGIGLLIFSIRTWGGYPDGVAFAVLLIGLTVPLLDYYTTPRVFGVRKSYEKS